MAAIASAAFCNVMRPREAEFANDNDGGDVGLNENERGAFKGSTAYFVGILSVSAYWKPAYLCYLRTTKHAEMEGRVTKQIVPERNRGQDSYNGKHKRAFLRPSLIRRLLVHLF